MKEKEYKKSIKSEYKYLLRLDKSLFDKVDDKVYEIKKSNRKYSINKYITELIEKDLKEGRSNE